MSSALRLFIWTTLFTVISGVSNAEDCATHSYKTHLFSKDPLVIYIESFINLEEASQLVDLR